MGVGGGTWPRPVQDGQKEPFFECSKRPTTTRDVMGRSRRCTGPGTRRLVLEVFGPLFVERNSSRKSHMCCYAEPVLTVKPVLNVIQPLSSSTALTMITSMLARLNLQTAEQQQKVHAHQNMC